MDIVLEGEIDDIPILEQEVLCLQNRWLEN
jgi:hypothetical protein